MMLSERLATRDAGVGRGGFGARRMRAAAIKGGDLRYSLAAHGEGWP